MTRIRRILSVSLTVLGLLLCAAGQDNDSPRITFINASGEKCLVKLVGPTSVFVDVPNATQRAIAVRGGTYYILTRYGEAGHFRYTRGDPFDVTETPYSVSDISITLHKVVGGNYRTKPDSGRDF
jgi:hypothetical protein